MGIESASEAWEGVDESGSLVPQLKGNTRVSELIPRGHGPGCPQTRHVSVTVLKWGDSDQKRRQAQIIHFCVRLETVRCAVPLLIPVSSLISRHEWPCECK
jgi:hypothetical protein